MGKKKPPVKVIVLDILKPHKPDIIELSRVICGIKGISKVTINVYATDEKTESIKATIEGSDVNFEKIKKDIEDYGAVIHSIDNVRTGK